MLSIRTAYEVAEVLWPDFVERDGVILLPFVSAPTPLGEHATLTEFERFHAHTHLQDLFDWDVPLQYDPVLELDRPDGDSAEHAAAWGLARRIGRMWLLKLAADFPAYRFRVYVTRLDDPMIHFHRVRDGEPPWISDEAAAEQVSVGDLVVLDSAIRASFAQAV